MIEITANTTLDQAKEMVLKMLQEDMKGYPNVQKMVKQPDGNIAKIVDMIARYHLEEFKERNMPKGFREHHLRLLK